MGGILEGAVGGFPNDAALKMPDAVARAEIFDRDFPPPGLPHVDAEHRSAMKGGGVFFAILVMMDSVYRQFL